MGRVGAKSPQTQFRLKKKNLIPNKSPVSKLPSLGQGRLILYIAILRLKGIAITKILALRPDMKGINNTNATENIAKEEESIASKLYWKKLR